MEFFSTTNQLITSKLLLNRSVGIWTKMRQESLQLLFKTHFSVECGANDVSGGGALQWKYSHDIMKHILSTHRRKLTKFNPITIKGSP